MPKKRDGTPSRRSGKKDAATATAEVRPSPAAQARTDIRLAGGVKAANDRVGPEIEHAEASARMVKLRRLDHTMIDNLTGKKYYPSEEPVEVPYHLAFTFGLIGLGDNQSTGRVSAQSLVTDDTDREEPETADNGQDGEGIPVGNAIPAVSIPDQPPAVDEIKQAAADAGRDDEAVLARRAAELEAIRLNRKEMGD